MEQFGGAMGEGSDRQYGRIVILGFRSKGDVLSAEPNQTTLKR
jgi:hypothetical protein